LAFVLSSCENPFPAETKVERLRILAVKADPPEVNLKSHMRFSALVVDPYGQGRTLGATWAICLDKITGVASDMDCPNPNSFVLPGSGMQADLSIPDFLTWMKKQGYSLENASQGPPLDSLLVLVAVKISAQDGPSIRAFKRIKLRLAGDQAFNTNPKLTRLLADGKEWSSEQANLLPLSTLVHLRPQVAVGSQDIFLPDGEDQQRPEDHLYSWFSTGGDFSDQRTILDSDAVSQELDQNDWTTPNVPGDYKLWLVARDGRYGTDWMEWTIRIE
jgi:hypothetical protein